MLSSENMLTKHKKDCLSINGKQSVKLEEGTTDFENYFKQIPVPFKIYAEFIKAILKGYKYCKKVMNKLFNKNLVRSE